MTKARDAFRDAFKFAGNDPKIAKIHFYQGLALLAEDVEEIIALLRDIKLTTQGIFAK